MGHVTRYGTAKGSIPPTLQVVLRHRTCVTAPAGKFQANAAYVTDPESKTSLDTALRWAKQTTGAPKVQTVDNDPIEWLRVVDIDERGEGGRAWKVLDFRGWMTDLREDVVLDCFKARCVMQSDQQNGGLIIRGPFRWVKYGTAMRLALIDSDLYREIASYTKAKAAPKLKASDLVRGGVYALAGEGHASVFLGKVRLGGQPRLAFFQLGGTTTLKHWREPRHDFQGQYDRATCTSPLSGSVEAILQTSHAFVEKVGQVNIGSLARINAFRDGYYTPLKPERVEWVDPQ